MKFLFTLMLQLITVGFLLKLVVRLLVPRPIRKFVGKSTMALCRHSFEIIKEINDGLRDDDDDDIDSDVDDKKVVELSRARK
jgi:hypothetical protein